MKLKKEQLKSIIKECLVEILTEGMGNALTESIRPRHSEHVTRTTVRQNQHRRPSYNPALDEPITRQKNNMLADAVRRESGGDPIMESILADTARTTLPSMMNGGDNMSPVGSSSAPGVTQQEHIGDPSDVFGEDVASKWADLAFATVPKRG